MTNPATNHHHLPAVISEFISLQLQSGTCAPCPTSTRHRVLMASADLSPRSQGIAVVETKSELTHPVPKARSNHTT